MHNNDGSFSARMGAQQKQALNVTGNISGANALHRDMLSEKMSSRADSTMVQRDASPVESALDVLSKHVEVATMQMNHLAQRLVPVSDTSMEHEDCADPTSYVSASAIESRIDNITRQVSRIASQLADMRAALRI